MSPVEKRDCAARELKMRERVYPRWVQDGRMSAAKAAKEIAIMRAIRDDYAAEVEAEAERASLFGSAA